MIFEKDPNATVAGDILMRLMRHLVATGKLAPETAEAIFEESQEALSPGGDAEDLEEIIERYRRHVRNSYSHEAHARLGLSRREEPVYGDDHDEQGQDDG